MSTITPVVPGDVELARLLASAASCGWDGAADHVTDIGTVATRCEWPTDLLNAVRVLPSRQQRSLASAAAVLLTVFAHPRRALTDLNPLLTDCRVSLTPGGVQLTTGDTADDIASTAAIGLINLIAAHGPAVAAICAWPACTQPLIRTGRHHGSTACSPRCANRLRVARHRHRTV